MTKDLINIQNKINQSIKTLCGYLDNAPANDRRIWLVPTINNLEKALEEIKLINAYEKEICKNFAKLESCRVNTEHNKEESNE